MDVKLKLRLNPGEVKKVELTEKTGDVAKYNLRCNRHVSEKMMKKDFVYDIRRSFQTAKKLEGRKKIDQPERATLPDMRNYSTVLKNRYTGGGGDATILPLCRTVKYRCNFCHEPIATLFSLSTHVKFHRRKYCKVCYWVFEDGEMMKTHFETVHQRQPSRIHQNS